MANSYRCPNFPKIKPKKGTPSENRNPSQRSNQTQKSIFVKENLSFANALKGEHQMSPRSDAPSSASSEPETSQTPREKTPATTDGNNTHNHEGETFGFMDAIIELKKFFTDYPSLLELGRQLKYAKGTARIDVFYRHLINMK
ncbi:hypothetical protein TNCV_3502731 [Trichonephila clavipes]|uniref:Uncharacterized protein n=1 Tax=Trichonephila clavipes TaxID=2585209 RepID=A0A8X6V2P1_TRICX|nr:hypothetical protein TNCV_3502731 [Trichonephila clavipes]